MKVTALMENLPVCGFTNEHGLAIHIEHQGKQYLLDTGASNQYRDNAEKLGIHLEDVDYAVLSHSHFDHSKGFVDFFEKNSKALLYLQESAKEWCYAKLGFVWEYVGIPRKLLLNADRIKFIQGAYTIQPGVYLLSHTTKDLWKRGKKAFLYRSLEKDSKKVPDDFSHEQSLIFEAKEGLVILNSCSHGGADNIVNEVKEAFPGKEILAIIGGFHLMGALGPKTLGMSKRKVRDLAATLKRQDVKAIYTGHCTGKPGYKILKEELGEQLHYFTIGSILEWE